jgi:hypothetical protein
MDCLRLDRWSVLEVAEVALEEGGRGEWLTGPEVELRKMRDGV